MTEELIIDEQHVDLAGDSSITLDFRSGMFSDFGKLSLSHSYTITLPPTSHNCRIFDDPGNPAHRSSKVRRFLPARYYRNGFDILGSAQATILRESPDGIEVVLFPSFGSELQAWTEAAASLHDLQLPTLPWSDGRDANFATDSSDRDIFFGHYSSGLPSNPYVTVGAACHPVVSLGKLLRAMAAQFNMLGTITTAAAQALDSTVLLASTRKPSLAMELESGSSAQTLSVFDGVSVDWAQGWDAVVDKQYAGNVIKVPESGKLGFVLNIKPQQDFAVGSVPFIVRSNTTEKRYYFERDANGVEHCSVNEVLELEAGATVSFWTDAYLPTQGVSYYRYDSALPAIALYNPHDHINIYEDNRFPVAVNLPDLKQVDLLKGACSLLGLVAYLDRKGRLCLSTYEELLDYSRAVDWTDRLDGELAEVQHSIDGYARTNYIKFKEYENSYNLQRYNYPLQVGDSTLDTSRDLAELPFSASAQVGLAIAKHYAFTKELNEDTMQDVYTLEDQDITPRVFGWEAKSGSRYLNFVDFLAGEALASRYAKFQDTILHPTIVKANIRMTEANIATMELQRPVYLAQTGQYYCILTLRYTPTGSAEVELIQI